MGAFSNGRPASAGGTGQAPSWHSSGTQSALARAAGANPLLAANPSFLAGGGGGQAFVNIPLGDLEGEYLVIRPEAIIGVRVEPQFASIDDA